MRRFIVLLAVGSLLAAGCATGPEDPEYSVRYEVTGTCSTVDVTIENEGGGVSQYADVAVPWRYSFPKAVGPDTFVYVSAQNQQQYGSVTATIYVDGRNWRSSTSSGAYVIATASGML